MDLYKEVIKHISFNNVHKSKYKFHVAGSIYRGSTDPSDIDIIMVMDDDMINNDEHTRILHSLKSDLPMFIRRVGDHMVSFELILPNDKYYTPIQIWLSSKSEFPFMLLAWGAGTHYNVRIRKYAKRKGYILNQYGLYDSKTKKKVTDANTKQPIEFKTVADIQRFLGVTMRDISKL
jgi:DNA polymerase/3'-5' exonuclease PolX